ncbi:hypothetical protein M8818_004215 [Zalaria obscura]|uniref:Uncharacterized protein n=1 Tax=Zalaria obscura TaxID=2024903 RepID=A0ACC3SCL0_9PEZI
MEERTDPERLRTWTCMCPSDAAAVRVGCPVGFLKRLGSLLYAERLRKLSYSGDPSIHGPRCQATHLSDGRLRDVNGSASGQDWGCTGNTLHCTCPGSMLQSASWAVILCSFADSSTAHFMLPGEEI